MRDGAHTGGIFNCVFFFFDGGVTQQQAHKETVGVHPTVGSIKNATETT